MYLTDFFEVFLIGVNFWRAIQILEYLHIHLSQFPRVVREILYHDGGKPATILMQLIQIGQKQNQL